MITEAEQREAWKFLGIGPHKWSLEPRTYRT